MQNYGIVVADKNEINKFNFPLIEQKKINQFNFNTYLINGNHVTVVHSGIGIVNAAAATQELISSFKVSKIFSYGAVGGDDTTHVYDLIIPNKIYFYDVKTPWYDFGQTPGEQKFYNNDLKGINKNLASGNSFLSSKAEIFNIKTHIDVHIFDMETAAIAQVAYKNKVKIAIIKCVSDVIGKTVPELEDINFRITKAGQSAFEELLKHL